ncbi:uncharacterized protein N7446_006135 [Penicillium canescens]|uniref:uncharacterized protein n=1 Tax=Penicillium canescens TaxID=5083 RepID=UPI0026E06210|nr:uncharacterized protein N7446_006135 [Penicillium canescens]KAJ6062015.1 hypothetical protein N7446_006135 [Penicillium canescens]
MASVKLLVEAGARANSTDQIGATPISYALASGHQAVARLLTKGAGMDSVEIIRDKLLVSAVDNGHAAIVERLLDNSASTEGINDSGQTPLPQASKRGDETLVRLLLDKGAATEAADFIGRTPLAYACTRGQEAIVQILLDKEAAVDTTDTLLYASRYGYNAVVRVLLEPRQLMSLAESRYHMLLNDGIRLLCGCYWTTAPSPRRGGDYVEPRTGTHKDKEPWHRLRKSRGLFHLDFVAKQTEVVWR